MSKSVAATKPVSAEAARMHEVYRAGGEERAMAPHVVYQDPECPHKGCHQRMQAIDFRLEAHGREVHDPLVRAWWNDTGFAGQCPTCRGWVHFTIRGKRAVSADEAAKLPQLPHGWFDEAVVL